jgi:hypothetical protein
MKVLGGHVNMSNSIIRKNYKDDGFIMTSSPSHKPQHGFIQFMRCFVLRNYLHMMPFDPSDIVEFKQNTADDPHIRKSNISEA